ncbi:hypothetical protein [Arthrobacter sp. ok362]|uniref:hypothetical protein n=1 Tax=Arthrobacter sp. ok362 TaxID=1761745 RepID=UPI001587FCFD|nr:hypothetical protein [Arthrobacter sp. ok362]
MAGEEELVKRVIAKYGPVLDLDNRPQELIDIIRTFQFETELDDGGSPGGVPPQPPPPPPPGPTSFEGESARLDEIMRAVLDIARRISKSNKDIKAIRGHLGI